MMARGALIVALGVISFALSGSRCLFAQNAPKSERWAACGVDNTQFETKPDRAGAGPVVPPPGKALVYVIEQMTHWGSTRVNVGVDGRWIAQLSSPSYTSVVMDPGVHHLCAEYEGPAVPRDIDSAILHRLKVQAGKTYYLLYRGVISEGSGEVGFFDLVDEDEGRYALESSQRVTSTIVQKK